MKIATTRLLNEADSSATDLTYETEVLRCMQAARENVSLCKQVHEMRSESVLTHWSVHYLFNGALNLVLLSIIRNEDISQDTTAVLDVVELLKHDVHSNREFAHDCAKVLTELLSVGAALRQLKGGPKARTPPLIPVSHLVNSRSPLETEDSMEQIH
jgi:hypothetical protein